MRKILLAIFFTSLLSSTSAMDVFDLRCEMLETPLAINTAQPRLGWKLTSHLNGDMQTAYHITVKQGTTTVWNTGKIQSGDSQLIPYAGSVLAAGTRYTWTAKVWDSKGKMSESQPTFFDTAPNLQSSDTHWIGAISRKNSNLPIGRRDFHGPSFKKKEYKDIYDAIDTLALRSINLRKAFNVNKTIAKAIVHASGLGHYNLYINGNKVSKDIFTPVWSDYDKTLYYNTYQVDTLLSKGENVLGITLGNGFYNAVGNRYRKLWITFGPPTLFLEMHLHYTDGTKEIVSSDQTWKYTPSPITFNDIYGGEDYDARLEQAGWNLPKFDDSTWQPVVIQEAPKGTLRPQLIPSIKKMEEYAAKTTTRIDSSYVMDMGQNLSGYPAISLIGKKGQTIKLTVGEQLDKNTRKVSQKQSGGPHTYYYTLKGEGTETWHPEFTFYGFQYIQIDGANMLANNDQNKPSVTAVKSHFVYNSTSPGGDFRSSNEIFNKAHLLIKNAVKSNMQSMFTDCPHREKLGWLEETHLNGPGLFYNWNLTQYFPKTMQDIADAQRDGGLVPNIVPEYIVFGGDFTDSPEWGAATIMVPWMYYKFYGDDRLLKDNYTVMKNYVDYLTSKATNHIVSHGLGDWYDYGEHRAGFSMNSPIDISATAHYYYLALLFAKAAEMQNKNADAAKYSSLANEIKTAFNNKFFDRQTMQYGSGSQFCNAIAIYMKLVEPQHKDAVMENLKNDIINRGVRLTTGDVGNRYLFQALALNGENELMYKMHNHEDAPGYGFQAKFGATTLTEQWDPRKGASWNHFMMGQIDEWFFRSLAGIEPSRGFKEFTVQPQPVGDLSWVKAKHQTLYGDINVEWKKEKNIFTLTLAVPVNTTAKVILPNGQKHTVKSGKYTFRAE